MSYDIQDLISAINDSERVGGGNITLSYGQAVSLRDWIISVEHEKRQYRDDCVGYKAELSNLRANTPLDVLWDILREELTTIAWKDIHDKWVLRTENE